MAKSKVQKKAKNKGPSEVGAVESAAMDSPAQGASRDTKFGEDWFSDDEENEKEEILKFPNRFPTKDDESSNEDEEELANEIDEHEDADDASESTLGDRAQEAIDVFDLPKTAEDLESQDPKIISQRIKETLDILSDFRTYQQNQSQVVNLGSLQTQSQSHVKSRSEFIEQLSKDCAIYYGYLPTLIELFLGIFSPSECVEFLEANEQPRSVVIRTNTLRISRKELVEKLVTRGVNLEPLADWSDVGLKVFSSNVPVGATPEYLAGFYMLQSASSFAPVLALGLEGAAAHAKKNNGKGFRVLDMASAPGGKTSYICQLMSNTGVIVANDLKPARTKSTMANLSRLGCSNVIYCNHDGRDFPRVLGGFDRVLLDAPCSGLGVVSKDPSVKLRRTVEDVKKCAVVQKQLLLSAIDSVVVGGIVVYSTCSISVEENEMVVQYALENRDVKIVESGLKFAKPGLSKYKHNIFDSSMKLCKRMYPHVHNMDGFFVCKLKKLAKATENDVHVAFGKMSKKQKKKNKKRQRDENTAEVSEDATADDKDGIKIVKKLKNEKILEEESKRMIISGDKLSKTSKTPKANMIISNNAKSTGASAVFPSKTSSKASPAQQKQRKSRKQNTDIKPLRSTEALLNNKGNSDGSKTGVDSKVTHSSKTSKKHKDTPDLQADNKKVSQKKVKQTKDKHLKSTPKK